VRSQRERLVTCSIVKQSVTTPSDTAHCDGESRTQYVECAGEALVVGQGGVLTATDWPTAGVLSSRRQHVLTVPKKHDAHVLTTSTQHLTHGSPARHMSHMTAQTQSHRVKKDGVCVTRWGEAEADAGDGHHRRNRRFFFSPKLLDGTGGIRMCDVCTCLPHLDQPARATQKACQVLT